MAILRNTLLGLVAACVTQGAALAQDPEALFNAAWRDVMLDKKEDALAKLEGVLRLVPNHQEAWDLFQKTQADRWQELRLAEGEIGKIAKHLADLARQRRIEINRDTDLIADLVESACDSDYQTSSVARIQLANRHSEYAVPALIEKLGDEDTYVAAIQALVEIGRRATPALIEALQTNNADVRRGIAATLQMTLDSRALPAITALTRDGNEGVVTVAVSAVESLGGDRGADAVSLYTRQAQDYLMGRGTQGLDYSEVVWSFVDGALTYADCLAEVYPYELAKRCAEHALNLDPSSDLAKTLVARSYLAQTAAIQHGAVGELADALPMLRMVAMATGPATLSRALSASLDADQSLAAVAAIEALGDTLDPAAVADSGLITALSSTNSMVRYAAALAVTRASRGGRVPQSGRVVAILGEAITEEAVRQITAVGLDSASLRTLEATGNQRGYWTDATQTIQGATRDIIFGTKDPDVILVNDIQSDGIPMDIIGILANQNTTSDIKVILVTDDEDGANELYGDRIAGVLTPGFQEHQLRDKVNEVLADLPVDSRAARASRVAIDASNALHGLASSRVDVSAAMTNIAGQLNREDDVAIPAAGAIGEGGRSIDALVAQLSGDGSAELKQACAEAAGAVLSRIKNITPAQFEALKAMAIDGDVGVDLRKAVATALGQALLSPAQRLELLMALHTAATVDGDS